MTSTRNLLMEATAISEAGATWGNMGQSLQDEDRYETDVPEEANWRTRAQQFRTQKAKLYKIVRFNWPENWGQHGHAERRSKNMTGQDNPWKYVGK